MSTKIISIQPLPLFSAALLLAAGSAFAQSATCSQLPTHPATPAEAAYQRAKYESAESLYQQALLQKPNDPDLNIALVHTLLHESRISDAATRANQAVAEEPRSAGALTALAEVQLRQGQPWLASQTLDSAAAADPCYPRAHLIRSRIFRIDSMYASERAELQAAYKIDTSDPDIQHAWRHTVNPANDIQRIEDSLATINNLDPDIRAKAQASANSMLSLLSENSQTCQSAPITAPVTLPLIPSYENVKQISAYKLAADLPKGKAKLTVDTASSGLYIGRALAETNNFQHAEGASANTVRVDNLKLGPLQFRNCMVGVSETAFPDGVEGFSLRIIGVAGGDAQYQGVHNAMPTQVSGGGWAISSTAASMGLAPDDNMKPGVAPNTVHPGIVAGIPHLKLIPEGGPQCSAMLTSDEHTVQLGTGTEFILTMQSMP